MPSVSIRKGSKEDIKLIKNLSWQTFFETFHSYNTKEDMELFLKANFSEEVVRREVADHGNIFLLAYMKKEPVGYAKLSETGAPKELKNKNAIEISRIYTLKEKIGSGVGKALMGKCLDTAQEKDKSVIWLGVWEHNQRAIDFYRRWGFEKFNEHYFMVGNDRQNDWLMKRELK